MFTPFLCCIYLACKTNFKLISVHANSQMLRNFYVTYLFYFRKCLHNHIITSNGAKVLCPFHYELACGGYITEAEICQVWFVLKFHAFSLYITQIHTLQNFTHTYMHKH